MRKTLLLGTFAGALVLPGIGWAGGFSFDFGWHGRDGSVRVGVDRRGHRPSPSPRVWIPGHYEERIEYVTIPGGWRNEWVPPVFQTRHSWGCREQVMVRQGYWRRVWVPARTESRVTRVWIPGHFR